MREKLNELLARQHQLGLQRSAAACDEYVRVSVEILRLAKAGADLSPNWKVDNPMPVRKNIETVEDLAEAKTRLAALKARQQAGWFDEYRDLANQISAVENIILDRARRGEAA